MSTSSGLISISTAGVAVATYETQTGAIAEPTVAPMGNGHVVVVYNSTLGEHHVWVYSNSGWHGVEVL